MFTIKERNIGVKIQWAEVELCLVRASQYNFCGVVWSRPCTDLPPRYFWTHRELWGVIDAATQTSCHSHELFTDGMQHGNSWEADSRRNGLWLTHFYTHIPKVHHRLHNSCRWTPSWARFQVVTWWLYRGADKSLARPTFRCILMVRIFRLMLILLYI